MDEDIDFCIDDNLYEKETYIESRKGLKPVVIGDEDILNDDSVLICQKEDEDYDYMMNLPDFSDCDSDNEDSVGFEFDDKEPLFPGEIADMHDIDEKEEEDDIEKAKRDQFASCQMEEEVSDVKYTFPYLTRYERILIIGSRIHQIISGSVVFVDVDLLEDQTPRGIAEAELIHKVIPFQLKRPLPNGKVEVWDISDLEIID